MERKVLDIIAREGYVISLKNQTTSSRTYVVGLRNAIQDIWSLKHYGFFNYVREAFVFNNEKDARKAACLIYKPDPDDTLDIIKINIMTTI